MQTVEKTKLKQKISHKIHYKNKLLTAVHKLKLVPFCLLHKNQYLCAS